jgi:hypothetical protein
MSQYLFYRPQADLLLTLEDAQGIDTSVRANTPDDVLHAAGLHRLISDGQAPSVGRYEFAREVSPAFIGGEYRRRYRVMPMFPCDTTTSDGLLMTVAEQQARFDSDRLAEAKQRARAQVATSFGDAMTVGLRLADGQVLDLDDGAALLRQEVSIIQFGADEMPLFLRGGGMVTLPAAEWFGAASDASRARVAIHQRRAEILARIEAAQTEDLLQRLDLLVWA